MATARGSRKKTSTRSRSRAKKNSISVDFEGIESGGGRPIPDGQYTASLSKCTQEEGQESGEAYLSFKWKMESGKAKGAIAFDNLSLQEQSLWRLRTALECLGMEVPEGVMDIDLDEIIGLECEVEIVNEEWEGRDRPRVVGYSSIGGSEEEYEEEVEEETEPEPDEEEAEEEEPKRGSKKKRRSSRPRKLKLGSKVKFQDEDEEYVRGVITSIEDDSAMVEDSSGSEWEVEVSELEAA